MATFQDFQKVEVRVGEIVAVEDFPDAKVPAYKLTIDFGPKLGTKRSSAQLTKHYMKEDLLGKRVLALVNIPPKQVGQFLSEVLTLGVPDTAGEPVLAVPEKDVPLGGKLY